jgi:hypothetical protein
MERMAAYASARRKAQPASLFGDFCNKICQERTLVRQEKKMMPPSACAQA